MWRRGRGGRLACALTSPRRHAATATTTTSDASGRLRRRLQTRDVTVRACTRDGRLRVCFCSTRHLLCETMRRHALWPRGDAQVPLLRLVGTQLSFTNLLACQLDGEERVVVRLANDAATRVVVCEALALGECRAYVRDAHADGDDDDDNKATTSSSTFAQPYTLKVDRVLYNQHRPFTSVTAARLRNDDDDAPHSGHDSSDGDDDASLSSLPSIVSHARALQAACGDMHSDAAAMAARVRDYFAHNATLHGVHLLRRSDGHAGAVLSLHTHLDVDAAARAAAAVAERTSGETTHDTQEQLQRARERSVLCSCGVLVLPLAAGAACEAQLRRLQRALVCADAALSPSPLSSLLLLRRRQQGQEQQDDDDALPTTCQDMLSLVTGDYAGARAVAALARQPLRAVDAAAADIAPLRRALGLCNSSSSRDEDMTFELSTQASDVTRTGIDFFCRCSKANVAATLRRAASPAALAEARVANHFACTYCGAVYAFTDDEWHDMLRK